MYFTLYWSQRFTDFFFKLLSNNFSVCPRINLYLTFHNISKVAYFKEVSKKILIHHVVVFAFLTSECFFFQIKYVFVFVLKFNDSIDFLFCFNMLKIGYYNVDVYCIVISSRMYFTMNFKYTCVKKKVRFFSARGFMICFICRHSVLKNDRK